MPGVHCTVTFPSISVPAFEYPSDRVRLNVSVEPEPLSTTTATNVTGVLLSVPVPMTVALFDPRSNILARICVEEKFIPTSGSLDDIWSGLPSLHR